MKARLFAAMLLASCLVVGPARKAELCGSAQLSEPFADRPGQPAFRLLVAWFSPDDPSAVEFGKAVGRSLAEELRKYLLAELRTKAAQEAGLAATDVQVRRLRGTAWRHGCDTAPRHGCDTPRRHGSGTA